MGVYHDAFSFVYIFTEELFYLLVYKVHSFVCMCLQYFLFNF